MTYFNATMLNTAIQISLIASMLLRNVIFAHFLMPKEFAIAMTFGVVLMLFEFAGNFGHEILMQRATYGGRRAFQASIHAYLIIRGILVASLVILFSPLISQFLKIPSDVFNYAALAIVPFINGFYHTDHQRLHRDHNYSHTARISILADVLSIIIAFICAYSLNGYWAFYISFVFRHSMATWLSHTWSIRPYLVKFNKAYTKDLWVFGLPFVLIGVLKYFGSESDKSIITRYIGLEAFSAYLLTMTIITGLTNFVAVGFSKIFMRRVSVQNDPTTQVKVAFENGIILVYLVVPVFIFMSAVGENVLNILFGKVYLQIDYLLPIACSLISIRIVNLWLSQTGAAADRTTKLLFADVFKLIGLCIAFYLAIDDQGILLIVAAFIIGELCYLIVLSYLLTQKLPSIWQKSLYILSLSLMGNLIGVVLYFSVHSLDSSVKLLVGVITLLVTFSAFYLFSSVCRQQTNIFVQHFFIFIQKQKKG